MSASVLLLGISNLANPKISHVFVRRGGAPSRSRPPMDGGQRRQATAVSRVPDSPARRLIAWLQLFFKAFVHRYGKLVRWDTAGRPVFILFVVFLVQKSLRRRYLSWRESSQVRLQVAVVTVQSAVRAMAARRELSLRRQTRAATHIQANLQRLHEMVDVLQQAVDDAEARAIAEREAAKKAVAEAPPVIKETVVTVEDTEKVNSLHAEVARLKDILGAEMRETFAAKKALSEAELRNEKLARSLGVEEVKNKRLQDSLKRMEEKVSNLDEENRKLRQAVASNPAISSASSESHEESNLQATPDNEKATNGAVKPIIIDREGNIHGRDNNDTLAYWLSNSCTLLVLLQRTLKTNGVASLARQKRRASPLKVPQENQDPNHTGRPVSDGRLIGGLAEVCQVEAKYPAIAFKQQLTALLEKVYGIIRHNLKKELSPLLSLCIQVPPFLICKLFTQVFSFINVQLFNSNGEYVKAGLDELEHWCFWLTEEALSMQQLYRISTMYCDDKYGTLGIPSEVISSMRTKMIEGSSSPSTHDDINSFLLDDDFSIPFSVDDIAKLMVHFDTADMDLPPLI
ncbi:hypothetical protein PR202_ga31651 [Eleusine coracana subsp. coracana]|uniref:Dilute domain-containing protein n=1 Tax=Eleusine coracana subsp. coracana TaxID=191504 RepID=A0AAV5DT12_ELECO|nr:hypothetical protein PR202_ga31651 [Eleusine coracana subsp. coracana]